MSSDFNSLWEHSKSSLPHDDVLSVCRCSVRITGWFRILVMSTGHPLILRTRYLHHFQVPKPRKSLKFFVRDAQKNAVIQEYQ